MADIRRIDCVAASSRCSAARRCFSSKAARLRSSSLARSLADFGAWLPRPSSCPTARDRAAEPEAGLAAGLAGLEAGETGV
ncbi:MAG TPA: hypothetical protein VIK58_06695, partial [Caldimonas sp.]